MVTLTRTNPHVVSYFDRFVRKDCNGEQRYCIMMDYVRGLNLLDYVKKSKPVNNAVVYWFLRRFVFLPIVFCYLNFFVLS
jgi:serine/threonine protein kinase